MIRDLKLRRFREIQRFEDQFFVIPTTVFCKTWLLKGKNQIGQEPPCKNDFSPSLSQGKYPFCLQKITPVNCHDESLILGNLQITWKPLRFVSYIYHKQTNIWETSSNWIFGCFLSWRSDIVQSLGKGMFQATKYHSRACKAWKLRITAAPPSDIPLTGFSAEKNNLKIGAVEEKQRESSPFKWTVSQIRVQFLEKNIAV